MALIGYVFQLPRQAGSFLIWSCQLLAPELLDGHLQKSTAVLSSGWAPVPGREGAYRALLPEAQLRAHGPQDSLLSTVLPVLMPLSPKVQVSASPRLFLRCSLCLRYDTWHPSKRSDASLACGCQGLTVLLL